MEITPTSREANSENTAGDMSKQGRGQSMIQDIEAVNVHTEIVITTARTRVSHFGLHSLAVCGDGEHLKWLMNTA